nr:transposase [Streptomyces marianii]
MSLQPKGLPEVPEQTAAVAWAAFPKGSLPIRVRDRLAEVADEPFTGAFGVRGAPGRAPAVLSLVTVLQFAENLTDRQAAAMAVRAIDWKYAIGAVRLQLCRQPGHRLLRYPGGARDLRAAHRSVGGLQSTENRKGTIEDPAPL